MPSRRSVLAAGGGVAVAAFAGCTARASPDGSPAKLNHSLDLQPEDSEIIAQTSVERIGCPAGDVQLQAIGFELQNNALQTLTRIDVFHGRNGCKNNWSHDGVDATHDWSGLGLESESNVTDTTSNVVYADSGGDVGLKNTSNLEKARWRVHKADAGRDNEHYVFRSTLTFDDVTESDGNAVSEGDEIAVVTSEVPLSTGGLLGRDSETVTLSTTLIYGRVDESS